MTQHIVNRVLDSDNKEQPLTGTNTGDEFALDVNVVALNDTSPIDVNVTNQVASAVNTPEKVSGSTDPTAAFANNAPANTQATAITITAPDEIRKYHRLIVHNPSTETDLTVKVWNKGAIGTAPKYFMGSVIIPAKATVTGTSIETDGRNVFQDLFLNNTNVEIQVSNNQVVGAAGAFTATLQLFSL